MKSFISITRFDDRSTKSNPIQPQNAVCSSDELPALIEKSLDEYHTLLLRRVSTTFDPELPTLYEVSKKDDSSDTSVNPFD